jgi:hypothetical protein
VVRDVRLGVGLGLEAQGVPAGPRGAAVPPRCAQRGVGASRPRGLPGEGNRAAPPTASLARCRAVRRGGARVSRRERSRPSAHVCARGTRLAPLTATSRED